MALMLILFWGGLIVLVVVLVRSARFGRKEEKPSSPGTGPDATEILRSRFARGEISEHEYRRSFTVLDETKR